LGIFSFCIGAMAFSSGVLEVVVSGDLHACAGDQHGNIRVWDLTASACSCELVPEVGTAVRSLSVALDGSLVVAANNQGAPHCAAGGICRCREKYVFRI